MDSKDYSKFVESAPSSEKLLDLASLVQDLADAEKQVLICEHNLTQAQAKQKDIAERLLPELMKELRLEKYRTTDGVEIELKGDVAVNVKKENRERLWSWMI